MLSFIGKRLMVSVALLLAASFIMYLLIAASGDPLRDLLESPDPNRDQLIADRVDRLNLDTPVMLRYFLWLGGAMGCLVPFANACDLGQSVMNQSVTSMLPIALDATFRLLIGAVILAIIFGVGIGIVSALRQHTGFDYSLTFFVFLMFSLPSFFIAVLLKEFGAISFNDFLQDPVIPPLVIGLLAVVAAVVWQSIIGGDSRRRIIVAVIAGAATAALLIFMSATRWFATPGLGPIFIGLASAAIGVLFVALLSGLHNRRGLLAVALTSVAVIVAQLVLQPLFAISTFATVVLVGVAVVAVGGLIGFLLGGQDRMPVLRIGAITALVGYLLVILDRFLQSWPAYVNLPAVGGRPIATIGSANPTVEGNFWIEGLDSFTHYLLPTATLLLISLAAYTRYVRAGMLEVLQQDYIRTARSKGLSEGVVVMRHAFRNALIPLATFIPVDVAAVVGGAIITEQVFAISGMGQLFIRSLQSVDPNPVMAYFLVVATFVLIANILADLSYAVLDPRIRVSS